MLTITREEESTFPAFLNHKSAREWFKARYGNRFVMQGSEYIDGEKIYFYHLVQNREVYLEGMEQLKKGEVVYGLDLMNSYQSIEVWENGGVHVIH